MLTRLAIAVPLLNVKPRYRDSEARADWLARAPRLARDHWEHRAFRSVQRHSCHRYNINGVRPNATQIMTDMGVDVITVEPPSGDDTRDVSRRPAPDLSGVFVNVNRGKRSIVLDIKSERVAALREKRPPHFGQP